MSSGFLAALAPDLVVLALVVVLMLLEMARAGAGWARFAFVAALAVALAIVVAQATHGLSNELIPGELRVDALALGAKAVTLLCALSLVAAFPAHGGPKSWLLAACSTLGGMVIAGSAGFATLFMGIEMLSLPAFALIVHDRGLSVASEGAFKYLVLSSVASALLLFGASLAYGLTGTLALDAWAGMLAAGGPQAGAAALLVLAGLFLKTAVFPFHGWAPDAYAAARLPVTALLASLVKAGVVFALLRAVGVSPLAPAAVAAVAVLALASIAFGNLAALAQPRFRRLLAYSSIAHAGYMIFALLDTTGARIADLAWYVAIYGIATVLACAAFARLAPGDDDDLGRLDGAFARQPVAAALLGIAMLSLAGLPPFPGFFAKLLVFRSVIASDHLVLAVLAFAGSFLGLAYYLGVALRPFRNEPRIEPAAARPERPAQRAAA